MITVYEAIQMTEKQIDNLPKAERTKAIETRKSYIRFMKVVAKVKELHELLGDDIKLTLDRNSPAGMKELPGSHFHVEVANDNYYLNK